jgi:hypothetical protein
MRALQFPQKTLRQTANHEPPKIPDALVRLQLLSVHQPLPLRPNPDQGLWPMLQKMPQKMRLPHKIQPATLPNQITPHKKSARPRQIQQTRFIGQNQYNQNQSPHYPINPRKIQKDSIAKKRDFPHKTLITRRQ